jgi:glycosyltransferase involved in cell wall biosynthesis
VSGRPKIVLLGMLTRIPVAGAIWQNVHYLLGLERLGFDPYYVEAHARTPTALMVADDDDASLLAARFLDRLLRRFGFGDRWAFHALHEDGRCFGLSETKVRRLYGDAELIVNVHGGTVPMPDHLGTGRLVYLETDPVELEIKLHDGLAEAIDFAAAHAAFATWGLNYGRTDCLVPLPEGIDWLPTPPPVPLDLWQPGDGNGHAFTTVGNWRQWGDVRYRGETYTWSKHHEFMKFLDLPRATGQAFELALASYTDDERRMLEEQGWLVRPATEVSGDLDRYRDYVRGSRAEFTVAKDQNVRLRSGWFSERSAVYLASGRPVITQDTGFGSYLPTGEGLFAFSTLEDAVAAVEAVEGDYRRHCRAAREIACEFLDADVVLRRLVEHYGVSTRPPSSVAPGRTLQPEWPRVSIVIPCFDLGRYLPETVESVRAQTYGSWELIIVDDGSTDAKTVELVNRYRDEGVKVIRTENHGAPAARNRGISEAVGEYVLCLDADDALAPAFLERTVPELESRPDAAFVTTHVELIGERGGIWRTGAEDPNTLLWQNVVASASLFRRSCWEESGGWAPLPAYQDWDFWLSLVERGWQWSVVPEVLYRYRVRSGSISQQADGRRAELLRTLVERHPALYEGHVADIVADMDAQLADLRRQLAKALAAETVPSAWPRPLTLEPGRVSIVIPCFNLGAHLEEAVASALAQGRPADEVIVVDDGSTDAATRATLGRCEELGARVLHKENGGAGDARNYGIERAVGEYVACLDADDVLLPDFLRLTVRILEQRPEVGIVTSHVEFFGEQTGLYQPPDFAPTTLLWRNCVAACSLFRKRAWHEGGGYSSLAANEDWDFWLALVERGWEWAVVPEVLYRYRKRAGSRSEGQREMRAHLLRDMVSRHRATYREGTADMLVEMDEEIERLEQSLARFRLDNNRLRERLEASTADERERLRLEGATAVREIVEEHVPAGAWVAVVSRGDDLLLELGERQGLHFPQTPDGLYLGHHPATGEEAVEALETLRTRGAEFVAIPASSAWWLDYYAAFRKHLVTNYWATSRDERCLVFDLRQELRKHTFTIVICTYNRAALLGKSIESAFAQDYPTDLYEIVVVNNNSTDGTDDVVRRYQAQSPVAFRYVAEPQQGLSHARNLGAELAQNEFVAFLDDDAEAVPHWLASFNGVIERCHALVVGGRIEKRFMQGFEPPGWFGSQYMKGFFGLNYREWGKPDRLLRIRPPLYIGGGNSAYARRVLQHFGGFDVQLGRDAKTLLAGEETHLNLVLEHNDIPIYYTDDAVIWHHIEPSRITRRHLVRKAYWAGISNAMISLFVKGWAGAWRCTADNRTEVRHLLRALRRSPRDPETFSRLCRVIYHLSFVRKLAALSVRRSVRRRKPLELERSWGPDQWLEEVARWQEGPDKYRHLYQYALQAGRDQEAREALEQLAQHESDPTLLDELWGPLRRREYERLVVKVQAAVEQHVPAGSDVLVVSKGDDRLVTLAGRVGRHFPQVDDGRYAGSHPADSAEAIGQLERLQAGGATHLAFPATAAWWLSHYGELARHLEERHRLVHDDPDVCMIYELDRTHRLVPMREGS